MKNKNKLLTLLILSAGTAVTTAAINKAIKLSAISNNILEEPEALCFKWRFGNIHYTKIGSGKPLLLIHDLTSMSSGFEWNQIIQTLKNEYTVYTIDLLGCGRSEKPLITYTNYLYVQLLSDFIKSEIAHRTDVITSGSSAAIATMTCSNSPELFDRIIFINPDNISSGYQLSDQKAKIYKFFLDLPILGTLLYHISSSKKSITEIFTKEYLNNPYALKSSWVDAYYKAAHLGDSPRSLYASVTCKYTQCNLANSLKKIDNSIYIIEGENVENADKILKDYKACNSAIEYSLIPDCKKLPQLECPELLLENINTFFA